MRYGIHTNEKNKGAMLDLAAAAQSEWMKRVAAEAPRAASRDSLQGFLSIFELQTIAQMTFENFGKRQRIVQSIDRISLQRCGDRRLEPIRCRRIAEHHVWLREVAKCFINGWDHRASSPVEDVVDRFSASREPSF